jgi:hypothetical protein
MPRRKLPRPKQLSSQERQRRVAERRKAFWVAVAANPHPLRLYRAGRLAELFDVNDSTIWRWRKNGVLPKFAKVGGIEGLTEVEVARLLEQRSQPGADRS